QRDAEEGDALGDRLIAGTRVHALVEVHQRRDRDVRRQCEFVTRANVEQKSGLGRRSAAVIEIDGTPTITQAALEIETGSLRRIELRSGKQADGALRSRPVVSAPSHQFGPQADTGRRRPAEAKRERWRGDRIAPSLAVVR